MADVFFYAYTEIEGCATFKHSRKVKTSMYTEDDTMTPRERISEYMLRRMLDGDYKNNGTNAWERGESGSCNNYVNGSSMALRGYPLASVYAPYQEFKGIYDRETALKQGTLFSELDLPFMGASVANKGGNCRG